MVYIHKLGNNGLHLYGKYIDGDCGGTALWDWFEANIATTYMIYPVNDGTAPRYQQKTAKERCIASR